MKEISKGNRKGKARIRGCDTVCIPGLITLAVESLNSWIKAKQNSRIDNAITIMRRSSFQIKNELRQYRDDFLMFGKYTAESLNDVIKTVNALHQKNTRLE